MPIATHTIEGMKKKSKRSKAAAILGHQGGTVRAKRMTAEERSESARKAAQTRWMKISGHVTEEIKARHDYTKKGNEGQ